MEMSADRSSAVDIMPEKPGCAECGKDAIGIQSFGCRTAFVCEDHAHSILLGLAPGRKYSTGECSFERFGAASMPDGERNRRQDCG